MANELLIGVKIGAALSGTFQSAFASARGTASRLGQVADELRLKHNRLGDAMARAMAHPTRNVGELRRQYERLGQILDQLRSKQERLTASLARGETLKANRSELRGQAMEAAGTALALMAPVVKSGNVAIDFQDQLRDVAITGEFSKAEEAKLGSTIRDAALKWNQFQDEIARGTSVLVAGGIQDAKALEKYAPVMAKAATATRASMDDLGSVAIALKDNLKVGEEGFEGALNMLAYAGKRGQFEIRDMAKWLPALSPSFQALGVTGKEAVAEIGAALQIARKGAGSNDEAANNFKNFLQKITAPDTLKDFANAGIDLKASMMNLRAQGLSPVQSMLAIITQYMQSKGPAAAGQFKQAMAIKDDKERAAALQRLSEAYKLGELFQDMQAMSFIRPAIANQEEMKDIQQGSMGAADKGFLDQDWKKRMEIAKSQIDKFKIGITELGLTIGNTLLPPISETIVEIMPAVKAFGEWAKAHPGVIKGVIGLVGGLLAGKMAFIGIKYGLNLVLSPLSALTTAITTVSSKWTLLRALIVGGGSRFSTLLQFFGMGAQRAGKLSGLLGLLGRLGGGFLSTAKRARELGSVLGGKLWGGLKLGAGLIRSLGVRLGGALLRMSSQALSLARVLSGGLLRGLMLAGRALLWLGRAAMMNPIGVAVMAIAGAAYLIYRYWTPIKAFFGQVWSAVDGVFKRYPILNYLFPIIGIPRLIMANWGRIKTFFSGLWEGVKQSMASAWSWMKMKVASWIVFWQPVFRFAGELPGKFLQAGKDLVMGLVNGIKSKIGAAKEAIVGLGADIKGWFAHTLGIKSPSRVFMGFGDNIAQGAAIGIQRSAAGAGQASGAMAQATIRGWGKPQLPMAAVTPDASHGLSARPAGSVPSGLANRVRTATQPAEATPPAAPAAKTKPEKPGYVIHFSPVIHLPAGSPEATKDAAQSAMKLSLRELEQMIRRITAQQERRAFN